MIIKGITFSIKVAERSISPLWMSYFDYWNCVLTLYLSFSQNVTRELTVLSYTVAILNTHFFEIKHCKTFAKRLTIGHWCSFTENKKLLAKLLCRLNVWIVEFENNSPSIICYVTYTSITMHVLIFVISSLMLIPVIWSTLSNYYWLHTIWLSIAFSGKCL